MIIFKQLLITLTEIDEADDSVNQLYNAYKITFTTEVVEKSIQDMDRLATNNSNPLHFSAGSLHTRRKMRNGYNVTQSKSTRRIKKTMKKGARNKGSSRRRQEKGRKKSGKNKRGRKQGI